MFLINFLIDIDCTYCDFFTKMLKFIWLCVLCVVVVPEEFCFDPTTRQYGDPAKRPEIKNATVEFIAPSEYMVNLSWIYFLSSEGCTKALFSKIDAKEMIACANYYNSSPAQERSEIQPKISHTYDILCRDPLSCVSFFFVQIWNFSESRTRTIIKI